jgi:hypothetical protein
VTTLAATMKKGGRAGTFILIKLSFAVITIGQSDCSIAIEHSQQIM